MPIINPINNSKRTPFNPLEPKYDYIQKYLKNNTKANIDTISPPFYSKFIKNSLDISDIENAQPMPNKHMKEYNIRKDIIDKSWPKKSLNPKKTPLAKRYFDYSDVNNDKLNIKNKKFITKRTVNPLEPEYILDYDNK